MGLKAQMKFSSDPAARLVALMASEVAAGSKVALNFVSEDHDILSSTTEQTDSIGVSDAFKWFEFASMPGLIQGNTPARLSTAHAWQFVSKLGVTRRVKVAILDGGFWLDSGGVPCDFNPGPDDASCPGKNRLGSNGVPCKLTPGSDPICSMMGHSDLPFHPVQVDLVRGGSSAGGPNPNLCTNGSICPWHGNKSAGVALGTLNNNAGAAGTGGQVADPILLKVDGTDDTKVAAIIKAQELGADIISMSFGHSCNNLCRAGHELGVLDRYIDSALDAGILLVASAGNDSQDAGDRQEWPCQYKSSGSGNSVYCVGALNPANDGTAAPYSNFGTAVNIWAPTNIHAMPDGGSSGQLTTHAGTSASAPYVAGVAAMMKAINPSLDGEHLKSLIGNGPYTVGTSIIGGPPGPYMDPKISLVIQPYYAVVAAAGGYHLLPELRIITPQEGANIKLSAYVPVQFQASVVDVNDGQWPDTLACPACWWGWPQNPQPPSVVTWKSDVDGAFPTSGFDASGGTSISYDFTNSPEGPRYVTASVTNSAGITNTATIAISVAANHVTPTPVITWPPNGLTIPPGTYTLTGYAHSTDPGVLGNFSCDRLVWNGNVPAVSVPNSNGLCKAQVTLAAGGQQITLSAIDKFGDRGTATAAVLVQPEAVLVVQIVSPLPGSVTVITMGAGATIEVSGNAAPIQPNSLIGYTLYWYLTSAEEATKKVIIGSLTANGSIDFTWRPESSGLCKVTGAADVTLRLEMTNRVPSNPSKNTNGFAEVNVELSCQKIS
jgi:hypothetical protein